MKLFNRNKITTDDIKEKRTLIHCKDCKNKLDMFIKTANNEKKRARILYGCPKCNKVYYEEITFQIL